MYHKSQFNHEVLLPGTDNTVCYNFRTRRFACLNPLQKYIFDMAPFRDVSGGLLKELHEKGMLTDEDEIGSLRREIASNRDHCRKLHLAVDVNNKCNFACEYCLETGQLDQAMLSRETADGIIRFVTYFVERREIDEIAVVWFGGEPMLDPETIEYISQPLIALADAAGIPYSAVIYTNGYLLTPENVRLLERCRVRSARISVDGPEEFNDRYRHLKNGQGTYSRIMRNIRATKTDTIYRIRCNLNRENLSRYRDLVEELKQLEKESGNRVVCSPERMKVEEYVNEDLRKIELTPEEYISVFRTLKDCTVREEDLDVFALQRRNTLPCTACLKYGFSVDVSGNIYKCRWIPGGRERNIIGNVHDFSGTFRDPESSRVFRNFTLPEKEKCLSCKLLPVCMGRCVLEACDPRRDHCHRLVNDLDWTVLTLYNKLKEHQCHTGNKEDVYGK